MLQKFKLNTRFNIFTILIQVCILCSGVLLVGCGGSGSTAAGGSPSATDVASITPAQIMLYSDSQIAAIGNNFNSLSNASLGALSSFTNASNNNGQIQSISGLEVTTLTPLQISIIAGIHNNSGISYFNLVAFGSLSASQVALLTPANVELVSASKLASLTPTAIAGFSSTTKASFTVLQKSMLSSDQHLACGCS